MPDVADHLPYLLIVDKPLPSRHSAHSDAIFDDPFHLAVCVLLKIARSKVRHWWRHVSGEWHARRVAVKTVAHLAVMLEVFGPTFNAISIVRHRVMPILTADYYIFALLNNF